MTEIREVTSLLPLSSGPGDTVEGAILLGQCQRKEKEKEKGFYVQFKCKRHDLPSVSYFSSALIWPRGLVREDATEVNQRAESYQQKGEAEGTKAGKECVLSCQRGTNRIKYFNSDSPMLGVSHLIGPSVSQLEPDWIRGPVQKPPLSCPEVAFSSL